MSYQSEHKRMPAPVSQAQVQPVLEAARLLDIATNPEKKAIFEAGSAGFQVWCTSYDHPKGWGDVQMVPGSFSKPCEFVGSVHWKWEGEKIVALVIETTAYALADQLTEKFTNMNDAPRNNNRRTIYNRNEDIVWLQEKVSWLFREAGVEMPPLEYEPAPLADLEPYRLAHYTGNVDDYVVIVSPDRDPDEFSQAGYELVSVMNIVDAGDFPLDIPLQPQYGFPEPDMAADEGPFVEQEENASRLGDDSWLESAFEDSISGFGEE